MTNTTSSHFRAHAYCAASGQGTVHASHSPTACSRRAARAHSRAAPSGSRCRRPSRPSRAPGRLRDTRGATRAGRAAAPPLATPREARRGRLRCRRAPRARRRRGSRSAVRPVTRAAPRHCYPWAARTGARRRQRASGGTWPMARRRSARRPRSSAPTPGQGSSVGEGLVLGFAPPSFECTATSPGATGRVSATHAPLPSAAPACSGRARKRLRVTCALPPGKALPCHRLNVLYCPATAAVLSLGRSSACSTSAPREGPPAGRGALERTLVRAANAPLALFSPIHVPPATASRA
eukprot:scaffold6105_cov75-Phaeocystis_antarctica.AAC.2